MIRSLGLPELIVIAVLLLLMFGGSWLARAGRVAGQAAKKKVLAANWVWSSITGTDEESLRAERAFGQEWAQEVSREFDGRVAEAKQASLDRLGARLCERQKAPWPFSCRVIAASEINAYALPGGFIFVSEPLFDAFHDDSDAMAFILAHEMAHVLLGHAREHLMTKALLQGLTAKAAGIGRLLKTLIVQGYSRDDELEADKHAVSLLSAAGFHVSGAARVLNVLSQIARNEPAFMEYFSSHPSGEERLKNLKAKLPAAAQLR